MQRINNVYEPIFEYEDGFVLCKDTTQTNWKAQHPIVLINKKYPYISAFCSYITERNINKNSNKTKTFELAKRSIEKNIKERN